VTKVVLEDLNFRYPGADSDTLVGLNLTVAQGEAHALLGSSGSGKSTLLNLLSGLLPAQKGRILFGDKDVGEVAPWQRGVTQVFQFPVLYEAMTVAANLAFPLRDLARKQQRLRVSDIASRLGLDDVLHHRPGQLTLVQKQLVAIAKALVRREVSLVLLDEPLTAAEPEHKWQLRQTLKSLQQELGATMIYVTHDQTEALTFADRVSVLHEGAILQTDTPQGLVERPRHEHVGYFVGTPGMNLLEGSIHNGGSWVDGVRLASTTVTEGPCQVGFRPEWALLKSGDGDQEQGTLQASIRSTRTLTRLREQSLGLAVARVAQVEITTRQPLTELQPGPGRLRIDPERIVYFRDGWRLVDDA
jgi:glycerol transport system ATP-binding protein